MRSNLKQKCSEEFCLKEVFHQCISEIDSQTLEAANKKLVLFPFRERNSEAKKTKSPASFFFYLLIALQVIDGIFTQIGINIHGSNIEGNPIIRQLIGYLGSSSQALLIAKLFSISAIILLWSLKNKVSWVPLSITLLCFYYLFLAILPWSVVLAGIV